MRRVKMWRYYCEFCGKGGCSGGHIKRHEQNCTLNPDRHCGICEYAENEQKSLGTLLFALAHDIFKNAEDNYTNIKIDNLKEEADYCPACILFALRQYCLDKDMHASQFDFAYENMKNEFWGVYNEEQHRQDYYGSL